MQASPFDDVNGRGIAYVKCKIACKYKCVIINGDSTTIIQGQPAAHFQGSQSSRGCRFLPKQYTSGVGRAPSHDEAAYLEFAAGVADFVLPIIPETKELLSEAEFVEMRLITHTQQPLANEPFTLNAPDGSVFQGVLDERGFARVDGVPRGQCSVIFERLGIKYSV